MNKGNRRNVVQFVQGIIWGIFAGLLPSARIKGFRLIYIVSERECKGKKGKENLSSIAVNNLRLLSRSPGVV